MLVQNLRKTEHIVHFYLGFSFNLQLCFILPKWITSFKKKSNKNFKRTTNLIQIY